MGHSHDLDDLSYPDHGRGRADQSIFVTPLNRVL